MTPVGMTMEERILELYLCSTPLQVLNAVEARHALGSKYARCVLVLFQRREDQVRAAENLPRGLTEVFDRIEHLRLEEIQAQIRVWRPLAALVRNRRTVLKRVASWSAEASSCPLVVVSNQYNRDMRFFAAKVNGQIVFADDGTSTAAYYETWAEFGAIAEGSQAFPGRGRIRRALRALLYRGAYGRFLEMSRPDYAFTRYVDVAERAGFSVIPNEYRWLSDKVDSQKSPATIAHFLGAPFVDRREVEAERYLFWLRIVMAHEPQMNWVYVPHPAETDWWIHRIERETGMVCERKVAPYELGVVTAERPPAIIASWFSSALESLAEIGVGSEIWAFRIPRDALQTPTLRRSAEAFYERVESSGSGISTLDLNFERFHKCSH